MIRLLWLSFISKYLFGFFVKFSCSICFICMFYLRCVPKMVCENKHITVVELHKARMKAMNIVHTTRFKQSTVYDAVKYCDYFGEHLQSAIRKITELRISRERSASTTSGHRQNARICGTEKTPQQRVLSEVLDNAVIRPNRIHALK